jgi:hypothetical protein
VGAILALIGFVKGRATQFGKPAEEVSLYRDTGLIRTDFADPMASSHVVWRGITIVACGITNVVTPLRTSIAGFEERGSQFL